MKWLIEEINNLPNYGGLVSRELVIKLLNRHCRDCKYFYLEEVKRKNKRPVHYGRCNRKSPGRYTNGGTYACSKFEGR